ncbi:hypothetical protein CC86DRAFT_376914 [Ophiobolus disseminans]|uniref:Uncharacterized protein n=1 Tax=Ophiobolus disseminans TaxID=1469910 RepID=A0A6A7AMK6_9PLEO|nr:hypothetical protein CC86DRAFT_376914 [Ophiobolus disseminans]
MFASVECLIHFPAANQTCPLRSRAHRSVSNPHTESNSNTDHTSAHLQRFSATPSQPCCTSRLHNAAVQAANLPTKAPRTSPAVIYHHVHQHFILHRLRQTSHHCPTRYPNPQSWHIFHTTNAIAGLMHQVEIIGDLLEEIEENDVGDSDTEDDSEDESDGDNGSEEEEDEDMAPNLVDARSGRRRWSQDFMGCMLIVVLSVSMLVLDVSHWES